MTDAAVERTFKMERSAIDEERFGVHTTRALVTTVDEARTAIERCRKDHTALLIVRCPSTELSTVQYLEGEGARLMDTLVYYGVDLPVSPPPDATIASGIRRATQGDELAVRRIAQEAFTGYLGHYHSDPRLDRASCDAVYVSWAENSVRSPSPSEDVFVAEQNGETVGFVTTRLNTPREGEVVLNAVAPRAQRRGIYRALMLTAMRSLRDKGALRLIVSTQITNLRAQRVWCRLGFEPTSSWYTLHHWLDGGPGEGDVR